MELKDIIKPAVTVDANASFKDAVAQMIADQSNSLLVVDDSGKLVGEVNVTDLLDAIVPEYLDGDSIAAEFATSDMFAAAIESAKDTRVADFMSKDIKPVEESDSLMLAAQSAISGKTARIPVIDSTGKPVGIISRRGIKQLIGTFLGIEDTA